MSAEVAIGQKFGQYRVVDVVKAVGSKYIVRGRSCALLRIVK